MFCLLGLHKSCSLDLHKPYAACILHKVEGQPAQGTQTPCTTKRCKHVIPHSRGIHRPYGAHKPTIILCFPCVL